MPFTLAHPAVALPFYFLRKRLLSITALITGSIAPDLEYFFKLKKVPSEFSHTLGAIFWFNVPGALLLAFLFHAIVKKPFIQNLPLWFYQRVSQYGNLSWHVYFKRYWPRVLFSVIVGTASHLLWDWFTHYCLTFTGGNENLHYTLLNHTFSIYTYTLIHVANSLAGLGTLLLFTLRLKRVDVPQRRHNTYAYWLRIAGISSVLALARIAVTPSLIIDDVVVAVLFSVFMAILTVSLYSNYKMHKIQ